MTKRHSAFTLVELLIAVVILGLVASSAVALFFSIFKSNELHQDITEAKQRGQIALAAMQPLVLNAGLGLPPDESEFFSSFQWTKGGTLHRMPLLFPGPVGSVKNFARPVQLAEDAVTVSPSSAKASPALWTVYSAPAEVWVGGGGLEGFPGVRTDVAKDSDSSEFLREYPLNGAAVALKLDAAFPPNTLKSWVTFPAATPPCPFTVADISTGAPKITLRSHSASTTNMIAPFDELHYVRAAKFFVEGGALKVDHLDGSGAQSIVEGIAGMWCTFDPGTDRILTVYILAKGDAQREKNVQDRVEGWPAEANDHWKPDSRYRYATVSRSWRIRN